MIIFEQEKSLETQIKQSSKASFACSAKKSESDSEKLAFHLSSMDKGCKNLACAEFLRTNAAKIINHDNPLIMYGRGVLVSNNINRNGDCFTSANLWASRKTPIDTPFNIGHNSESIVGHVYDVRAVDEKMNELDIENDKLELPELYHLEISFAIYQDIFPQESKAILKGFEDGTGMISLEVTFGNFDYALVDKDTSKAYFIERNKETCFLTKYLLTMGGTGVYDKYEVKRVLKDMTFSGVGSVSVGANNYSFLTNVQNSKVAMETSLGEKLLFSIETSKTSSHLYLQGTTMIEIKTFEEAKALAEDLSKKLEASNKSLAESNKTVETITAENVKAKADLDLKVKEIDTITKSLTDTKAELTKVSADLNEITATAKAEKRLAELKALDVEIKDEKAELDGLKKISDESFAYTVASIKKVKKAAAAPVVEKKEEAAASIVVEKPANDPTATIVNAGKVETEEDKTNKAAASIASYLTKRTAKKTETNKNKD